MKERPILFSGEMVRAILDGRKTQTRRIVKPQPRGDFNGPHEYEQTRIGRRGDEYPGPTVFGIHDQDGEWGIVCPYGHPGDRIWVRETWQQSVATRDKQRKTIEAPTPGIGLLHYRATYDSDEPPCWRPSIHMPRWASRITLEITGVRCERLNEISEADALAEGCEESWTEQWWQGYREFDGGLMHQQATGDVPPAWMIEPKPINTDHLRRSAKDGFRLLWESINGAGWWNANPWVWALAFKRIAAEAAA